MCGFSDAFVPKSTFAPSFLVKTSSRSMNSNKPGWASFLQVMKDVYVAFWGLFSFGVGAEDSDGFYSILFVERGFQRLYGRGYFLQSLHWKLALQGGSFLSVFLAEASLRCLSGEMSPLHSQSLQQVSYSSDESEWAPISWLCMFAEPQLGQCFGFNFPMLHRSPFWVLGVWFKYSLMPSESQLIETYLFSSNCKNSRNGIPKISAPLLALSFSLSQRLIVLSRKLFSD